MVVGGVVAGVTGTFSSTSPTTSQGFLNPLSMGASFRRELYTFAVTAAQHQKFDTWLLFVK